MTIRQDLSEKRRLFIIQRQWLMRLMLPQKALWGTPGELFELFPRLKDIERAAQRL
jgi:hypothetical protein